MPGPLKNIVSAGLQMSENPGAVSAVLRGQSLRRSRLQVWSGGAEGDSKGKEEGMDSPLFTRMCRPVGNFLGSGRAAEYDIAMYRLNWGPVEMCIGRLSLPEVFCRRIAEPLPTYRDQSCYRRFVKTTGKRSPAVAISGVSNSFPAIAGRFIVEYLLQGNTEDVRYPEGNFERG